MAGTGIYVRRCCILIRFWSQDSRRTSSPWRRAGRRRICEASSGVDVGCIRATPRVTLLYALPCGYIEKLHMQLITNTLATTDAADEYTLAGANVEIYPTPPHRLVILV